MAIILMAASTASLAQSGSDKSVQFIAWTLGSRISLAALGYAEGASQDVVNNMIDSVRPAAQIFGSDIPPLPTKTGRWAEDSAAVLHYLLDTVGETFGSRIKAQYPGKPVLLFEIAIKSNILLLMYGPGDSTSTAIVDVIRDRAPGAGVPQELWWPVVSRVEEGASYEQVKEAVVQMHRGISRHLSD